MRKSGKQLEKEEKKTLKADIAALRKAVSKTRPEKRTQDDLNTIRQLMAKLEASAQNAFRIAAEQPDEESEQEEEETK